MIMNNAHMIMKKHKSKLLTQSRSKENSKKSRPRHLCLRDTDTASLGSESCDSDVTLTSKDTLLSNHDKVDDRGYDVYEADSEDESDDDDEVHIDDDDDGYLFVDRVNEHRIVGDTLMCNEGAIVHDGEESDEDMRTNMRIDEDTGNIYSRLSGEEEDMRMCMRIHEETGRMYSRLSRQDCDLTNINGCSDQVMLQFILDNKFKVKMMSKPLSYKRPIIS